MSEIKKLLKESSGYLFFRNPVLVLGLVIGQLAAGVANLQNAAALSITYFFVVVPVLVFASAIGKKLPAWLKVIVYAIISAAMLVPSYFVSSGISATIFDSAGIYPALLAVSTVPIVYSSKISENQKPLAALINGIFIAAGFALSAFFLGAVREILGNGSLFGFKISAPVFPAAKLPFWGFIILGFLSAFVNFIKDFVKKPEGSTAGKEENA